MTNHTAAQPLDLDRLEALACAATPGPWSAIEWTCHAPTTVRAGAVGITVADTTGHGRNSDVCAVDAAFIAAANPVTVIALIAQARAAQQADSRAPAPADALPPMPSNVAHVTRRIRRCESDVPAQVVLEHFAMEYARAALAHQVAPAQPDELQNDIDMAKGALDLCEPEEQQAFQRILAAMKGANRG